MAKKKVRMLTALAGMNFSHQPGDIVSVDGEVAKAWCESGIAEKATGEAGAMAEVKRQGEAVKTLTEENERLRERVAALEGLLETAEAEKAELAKKAGENQSELPLGGGEDDDVGAAGGGAVDGDNGEPEKE